jgi:hypothetical protein
VIFRYVLWKDVASLCAQEPISPALKSALPLLDYGLEGVDPRSLDAITRIALRKFLIKNDAGRELAIDEDSQPIWLTACNQTPIAECDFSVRSCNCFEAASVPTLESLLAWTPSRLLELKSFGRKCHAEVSTFLGNLGFIAPGPEGSFGNDPDTGPPNDKYPLGCLLEAGVVVSQEELRAKIAARGWNTIGDIALHSMTVASWLADLTSDEQNDLEKIFLSLAMEPPVPRPQWISDHQLHLKHSLSSELERFGIRFNPSAKLSLRSSTILLGAARSLTEELEQFIPYDHDARKRAMISSLFGLGGADPLTLEEVAKRQTPIMVRERVRQIASPFLNKFTSEGRNLVWLRKALTCLTEMTPCTREHAENVLVERGILGSRLSLIAILKLFERAGLEHPLTLDSSLLLTEEARFLIKSVVSAARKDSSHWGVADWDQLWPPGAEYGAIVRRWLADVTWLGQSERYFVFPDAENSLANRLIRVLSVSPRLAIDVAYDAVFRDTRVDSARLPREFFSAFCTIWPWCRVEDDSVIAAGNLPSAEASGDDLLVILIREFGRPASRQEILRRALREGISENTVSQALGYSNVLTGANGHYSVVGDTFSAEVLASVTGPTTNRSLPSEIVPEEPWRKGGDLFSPSDEAFAEIAQLDCESEDFVENVARAVQRRVSRRDLGTPWSVAELALEDPDREVLFQWGKTARWEFRRDDHRFTGITGELIRRRTALGLTFTIFAAEAVRRLGGSGAVWPAINCVLGASQRELFLAQDNVPKSVVRDAVEEACRVFGIRHDFGEVGHQVWVRTFGAQYGISLPQVQGLPEMLTESPELNPIAVQLLLNPTDKMYSALFAAAWATMRGLRHGDVSFSIAESRLSKNPWTMHFPLSELLSSCLASAPARGAASEANRDRAADAYSYFDLPLLRWSGESPIFDYEIARRPPPWVEVDQLIFSCKDPMKREPLAISEDGWRFAYSPLSISLSHHCALHFTFDLLHRGQSQLSEPISVSLIPPNGFAFFNAAGAVLDDSGNRLPQDEHVDLLHPADSRIEGSSTLLPFRLVLGGRYRITRLPAGIVRGITLFDGTGAVLWAHADDNEQTEEVPLDVDLAGTRWGLPVRIRLPQTEFEPRKIRLNSGETVQLVSREQFTEALLTPGLSRAKYARLQGFAGVHPRSAKISLRHLSRQYGVAIEADGTWHPLQDSGSIETSKLRTSRLIAEPKDREFELEEARWMEGSQVIARPRRSGAILTECDGLGAALQLASGTYNNQVSGLRAASAVLDAGELRDVTRHENGTWSANLPFEEALSADHCLWAWTSSSGSPHPVPQTALSQDGDTLSWRYDLHAEIFAWALSFRGARIGSTTIEPALPRFAAYLSRGPWELNARWLRWWHAPVFHFLWESEIRRFSLSAPVDTCAAWLLPAPPDSRVVHDESTEEAWATACREMLWAWSPSSSQARELTQQIGIWSGDIGEDSSGAKAEPVRKLLRANPILLAKAASLAVLELYQFPRSQLAILIKLLLDTINPNSNRAGFDLRTPCDRYAQGENRLDGEFILRSLVEDAKRIFAGQSGFSMNLRIAFHYAGLREIVAIALLLDIVRAWQSEGGI